MCAFTITNTVTINTFNAGVVPRNQTATFSLELPVLDQE